MKKVFALAPAIITLFSLEASAHPGWVVGNSNQAFTNRNPATSTSPATGVVTTNTATTTSTPSRGYLTDGIRISHGCSDANGTYTDVKSAQVKAVSWVWPTGANGADPAPMSTGCDITGANCTSSSTQPSVATIPNSGQKPNYNGPWAAGMGTQASLADHLCTDSTCAAKISNIGNWFTPQGNFTYFKLFDTHRNGSPGFWAKNPKFTAYQTAALSATANLGIPFASEVQVNYVNDVIKAPTTLPVFSPASCARKLVVRPAGADICKIENKAVLNDAHAQNFWFGGPTEKFADGHGVHENFWMGYTLLVRDIIKNPYPSSCKDKVYGDYDLVVMPSVNEINEGLPFPGWARGK
jgi:hypothetical protein